MAVKTYQLAAVGTVHVYKRKGTRSLRLTIASDGKIRVTIPSWATYTQGLEFVHSKAGWIQTNMPEQSVLLRAGDHIGKAHRLVFETAPGSTVRTRLAGSDIRIIRPPHMLPTAKEVQDAAEKASLRALRVEAQKLLPGRLKALAETCGFTYTDVSIKQMTGRWGSCDNKQRIVLNLYLMQLPWHLIDYVLLHELTHTKHLNHSADFWAEFLRHEPRAKIYRTQIRRQKPTLQAGPAGATMA